MDRVTQNISIVLLASVVLVQPCSAWARGAAGLEHFPESRFGAPPARPDMGVSSGYAIRAVDDLEARNDELDAGTWYARENGARAGRSPAGLEITGGSVPRAGSNKMADLAPPLEPAPVNPTSAASAIARKGVQEVALIAGDLGFFPKTVFVSRDVPVRLFVTGASKNTLCIMMDSFDVRRQVKSQKIEEITFTPDTPGKFRFYCPVNGMEGTLIVKEFATQTDSSAE
ncbi:MAG: hypothetical protein A2X94_05990 [Bdellovibrionales bacterium GWB1_55_8]|nr:MAG: hypothetical protein A2X94_05990 [Bdellovibrionales bacterium GWB1_55_8]